MTKVGIIMGSDSDWPVLEPAYNQLKEFGLEVEVLVASAHRTPQAVEKFAAGARDRGLSAIIAAAGAAAHLAGVAAAYTTLPVIGVPISGSALKGMDALLSMAQMPPGIPVGVMAIDGGKNAALYAAAIIGAADRDAAARLDEFRQKQADGVRAKNESLQRRLFGKDVC